MKKKIYNRKINIIKKCKKNKFEKRYIEISI